MKNRSYLHMTCLAALFALPGCNKGTTFSKMAELGNIRIQAQQVDLDTGLPLLDGNGNFVLGDPVDPSSGQMKLTMGYTAFRTPTVSSFYLINQGESSDDNLTLRIDDTNNFQIIKNGCGNSLPPTIPGMAAPAPCEIRVSFNPKSQGSNFKANFVASYTTKGVQQSYSGEITGISVKEPTLTLMNGPYRVSGPVTAGTHYGVVALLFQFNGDPSDPTFPSMTFSTPSGSQFPNIGLGANISFDPVTVTSSQTSYSSALLDAIKGPPASSVYFLNSIQDATQLSSPPSNIPFGMKPCINPDSNSVTAINQSCYVLIAFAPSFTSEPFSQNKSPSASNWEAEFSTNVSLAWNYGSSMLTAYQRRTQAPLSGTGLNGVNLTPLTGAVAAGIDSTLKPICGPFLVSGVSPCANPSAPPSTSTRIVVSPVRNSDPNLTYGMPVQYTVTNNSGIPAEHVSITGLPLPSAPTAQSNYYFQSAADLQATTCINGTNIGPNGCKIYMHFAPSPIDYTPAKTSYNTAFSNTLQISYDYASYNVGANSSQTAPVKLSFTANAVAPANLVASMPSQSLGSTSLYCTATNSSNPVVVSNTGGYPATLSSISAATPPIVLSGCNLNTVLSPSCTTGDNTCTSTCNLSASFTPTTLSASSYSEKIEYATGTTQVYGQPGTTPLTSSLTVNFTGQAVSAVALPSSTASPSVITLPANSTGNSSNSFSSCGGSQTTVQKSYTFNVCGTNPFKISLSPSTNANFVFGNISCNNAPLGGLSGTVVPSASQSGATSCTFMVTGQLPNVSNCSATPTSSPFSVSAALTITDNITGHTNLSTPTFQYFFAPPSSAVWSSSAVTVPSSGSTLVGDRSTASLKLTNTSAIFPLTIASIATSDSPNSSPLISDLSGIGFPAPGATIGPGSSASFPVSFAPSTGGSFTRTVTVTYKDNNGNSYPVPNATIQANASSETIVQPLSTSLIDFGSYFTGNASSTSPSSSISVKILGAYSGWNSNLSNPATFPTPLPSWVQLDPTSPCIAATPGPVATKNSGPVSCNLNFKFNPLSAPSPAPNSYTASATLPYSSGLGQKGFPSPFVFKVSVSEPATTVTFSPGSVNFGTKFTDGSSTITGRQTITLTANGNYTNWFSPILVSALGLPSWVSVDSTSSCLNSPAGNTCQLNLDLVTEKVPSSVGTYNANMTIPYKAKASALPTQLSIPLTVQVSNPSANIQLFAADGGTPISAIALGNQMANITYPAGSYEANFMLRSLAVNKWSTGVQGNPTGSFSQGANYNCSTVTIRNVGSGAGSASATNFTLAINPPGISDLVLTNATNGGMIGAVLSNSCVDNFGKMIKTTLNPGESCSVSVCFAPTQVKALASGISLGGSYTSGLTSQSISTLPITGAGVQPARVYAVGNWTVIVDGLGQTRILGTGGYNGLSNPVTAAVQKGVMGGYGYCQIVGGALSCGSTPLSTSLIPVAFPGAAIVTDVAVGQNHACAIANSEVYCWGSNNYGQLGIGASKLKGTLSFIASAPQKVAFASGEIPIAVTAGYGHSCAVLVTRSSTVTRCWGAASEGQLGIGVNVPLFQGSPVDPDPLYFGVSTSSCISEDVPTGTLPADVTPANYETTSVCASPLGVRLPAPVISSKSGLQSACFAVSAGEAGSDQYDCATLTNGNVLCFGQNQDNQNPKFLGLLGPNLTQPSYGLSKSDMTLLPAIPLPQYDSTHASLNQLAMGVNYACALYPRTPVTVTPLSGVFCWGEMLNKNNVAASLGAVNLDYVDSNLALLGVQYRDPVMLTSGFNHACAVMSDNTIDCWGDPTGFGNLVTNPVAGQSRVFNVYQVFDAMK